MSRICARSASSCGTGPRDCDKLQKPTIESTEVNGISCLLVSTTRFNVTAKISGKSICCLLDSGFERSVIAQRLVSDLRLIHMQYVLSAANRTDLPVLGDANLHFNIDRHKFLANVSLSPAIDEFLLGSNWFVDNKCKWDFAEGTISVGDWLIHAHRHMFNDVCRHLLVMENCVMPSWHEVNIPV